MVELWTPGTEIRRPARIMTAERMRWYTDALDTLVAESQEPLVSGPNIHNPPTALIEGLRTVEVGEPVN